LRFLNNKTTGVKPVVFCLSEKTKNKISIKNVNLFTSEKQEAVIYINILHKYNSK